MSHNFPVFIERILSHEGGYSNDRNDPGNWTGGKVGVGRLKGTKFGIAANTYPDVDIKNLTRTQAIAFYKRDFWDSLKADSLPKALSFQMLDAAVNHGIDTARRLVQRALGVADDGKIGPITEAAMHRADPIDLAMHFFAERQDYYTRLSKFDLYGRGWMRRMANNIRYLAMDN